jgi:hypothetical protein
MLKYLLHALKKLVIPGGVEGSKKICIILEASSVCSLWENTMDITISN